MSIRGKHMNGWLFFPLYFLCENKLLDNDLRVTLVYPRMQGDLCFHSFHSSPLVQVFWRTADTWIPTPVDFPVKNSMEFSLPYDDKKHLEDIQYYIPENETMDICYIGNNKEKDRVWFIKEDLEFLKKWPGEKCGQKRTSMDGGWKCFRWWVSYRDRLLPLFSEERTTGLQNNKKKK